MSKDKSTIKDLVNGLKDKLGLAIKADPTLGGDIDKLHTLLADEVVPPAATFKEVKTKDGKILSIEGEMASGSKVNLVDEGGTATPAPDASYELEDGSILTVTGGIVTDIKAPLPAAPAPDPTMMAKMEASENRIKELETKLSESEKSRTELVAVFKKILETPVEAKMAKDKKEFDQAAYDKMSELEKRRYWREQNEK